MRSNKSTFHFYGYPSSILKILFAFICLSSTIKLTAQRTAEEKQSLCEQEKKNLRKLKLKWYSSLDYLNFYNKTIAGAKLYKARATGYDLNRLDEEINKMFIYIEAQKKKIKDLVASTDMDNRNEQLGDYESSNDSLQIAQRTLKFYYALSDYFRQLTVKKEFGESIDPNDNPLQKDITLLEQEKANAEESQKYLLNDFRMNQERIRQLACPVSDIDDDIINEPDASSEKDAKNKYGTLDNPCWPGSHWEMDPQTNSTKCFCDPGLVWNSTKTACVDPQELAKTSDCSGYPGSIAEWNSEKQRVECHCAEGKVWNSTKTACIDDLSKVTCYPGSHAVFNAQTNRTECACNTGLVWNSTKTACVAPAADPTNTPCWPGSHAAIDPQTNRVVCFCDPGLVWNSTRTACVLPGNVNNGTIPSVINWNGVYTGIYDMIVIFSGGSATYSWINGGHKETGSWTFTRVDGNTASGKWKEDYEDDDKKATRSGDISVTVSENSLHYDLVEDTPKFTWKNGIDPGEGGSSMRKGAKWSGSLQKKK